LPRIVWLVVTLAVDAGVRLYMPVDDGFVVCSTAERLDADIAKRCAEYGVSIPGRWSYYRPSEHDLSPAEPSSKTCGRYPDDVAELFVPPPAALRLGLPSTENSMP
jgi:hypothetical protein